MLKLMLAAVATAIGLAVHAETWTTNNVTYTYTVSDGVASIYNDGIAAVSTEESVIEIPATLGEAQYPVTIIGDWAFLNCSGLTNVTIPDSVTVIGDRAFKGCSGLTSVTIGNGVTSIREYAFFGCWSLTSVTMPGTLTSIGDNAFRECGSLTSVTMPDSLTSIGSSAFSYCGLTSVTIPSSVASIPSCAFQDCHSLTSVTIPDSVTSIGVSAFNACRNLTSVTIPGGVTSIGSSAFYRCSSLKNVTMSGNAPSVGYSVFGSIGENAVVYLPRQASGYEVDDGKWQGMTVHYLPEFTIDGNDVLTEVTLYEATEFVIPDGVTSIGADAFRNCSDLTSVIIPGSVTNIGAGAFYDCSGLTNVVMKGDCPEVGSDAFYGVADGCMVHLPWRIATYTVTDGKWQGMTVKLPPMEFAVSEVQADESSAVEVRVFGGSLDVLSSVKLYLTYNTATVADIDLAKGEIDGVTPKGGLKFPLTLSWEAGDIREKVVTIPTKADKAVEDDEFFTLQLAAPVGMELGEATVCKVTIRDTGYDDLAAKVAAGTATKAEQSAWDKLQKAKAPYILGLAEPADAGKVAGSGLCAAGKKVTLKATPAKGFVFNGWYDGDTLLSQSASYSYVMPSSDKTLTAKFATEAEDAESLKVVVSDDSTDTDGSYELDLGGCVTSVSAPKLAVSGLPAGLKYDAKTMKISGKATKPGVYTVTVAATNASVKKATPATTATFTLTVPNSPAFAGIPVAVNLNQAVPFEQVFVLAAGYEGYTVAVSGLPAGLKFDKNTGTVSGRPTKAGTYTVTLTATKKGYPTQVAVLTVVVDPLPEWLVGTFTGYSIGVDYVPESIPDDYIPEYYYNDLVSVTIAKDGKLSKTCRYVDGVWKTKMDGDGQYTSAKLASTKVVTDKVASNVEISRIDDDGNYVYEFLDDGVPSVAVVSPVVYDEGSGAKYGRIVCKCFGRQVEDDWEEEDVLTQSLYERKPVVEGLFSYVGTRTIEFAYYEATEDIPGTLTLKYGKNGAVAATFKTEYNGKAITRPVVAQPVSVEGKVYVCFVSAEWSDANFDREIIGALALDVDEEGNVTDIEELPQFEVE